MRSLRQRRCLVLAGLFAPASLTVMVACGGADARDANPASATQTLTLGAYTTPREVFGKEILPAFARIWRTSQKKEIAFEESYLGSGAQARAIIGGFEADVAALSLEPDIEQIAAKGLISHDWRNAGRNGMITNSVVVIGVRQGNPKRIQRWEDLARDGIEVLTPSPKTSGGAMWNVGALYGAAFLGHLDFPKGDSAAALAFLRAVLSNVTIMDKGARESMLTFEQGAGDAVISYENEVLAARAAGQEMDYIIPDATLLIESPVAVIDSYADKHGTRALADSFVAYLSGSEAQRQFAKHGFRPVDPEIAKEYGDKFPVVARQFTIADLGGWPNVVKQLFAPGAVFDRASARAASAP
jgi:sulfate/thiosulfate-binding protein